MPADVDERHRVGREGEGRVTAFCETCCVQVHSPVLGLDLEPPQPPARREHEMKTVLEVLHGARDLIADPTHWTQGKFARDKYSHEVDVFDPRADKFCLYGALDRAAATSTDELNATGSGRWRAGDLVAQRAHELFDTATTTVNDDGSRRECHAKVLKVLDETIRRSARSTKRSHIKVGDFVRQLRWAYPGHEAWYEVVEVDADGVKFLLKASSGGHLIYCDSVLGGNVWQIRP